MRLDEIRGALSSNPRPGSIHRPCAAHTRIATSQLQRSFSHSSYQKGIWDDDDEVSQPAPVGQIGIHRKGPVQPTRSAQPARPFQPPRNVEPSKPVGPSRLATHRNVGSLLRSRIDTKQLADNVASIEHLFQNLPSHELLVESFVQLRYQYLDDLVSDSIAAVESYQADSDSLLECLNKQIIDLILQITQRVAHAESLTQAYVSEFDSLAISIQERRDSVIAINDARVSEANAVTQQLVAEVETLSTSILERFTTLVSQIANQVRQSKQVTRQYLLEVKRLSSSIQGLDSLIVSVAESRNAISRIEHEFCATVFRPIPQWSQDLQQSELKVQGWESQIRGSALKLIASQVDLSWLSIDSLQTHFKFEFWLPRMRAQQQIDRIIAPLENSRLIYAELQQKSAAVQEPASEISSLCKELSQTASVDTEDAVEFAELGKINAEINHELRSLTHNWRAAWREKQNNDHGFKKMALWQMKSITQHNSKDPAKLIFSILRGSGELFEANQEKVRSALGLTYLNIRPDSIYWRQLNTMAPFELADMMTWRLHSEVDYLRFSLGGLYGQLWPSLPRETKAPVLRSLALWCSQFASHRSEFRADFAEFRYLNWLRLSRERRLGMRVPSLDGIKPLRGARRLREINRMKNALKIRTSGSPSPQTSHLSQYYSRTEPFIEWVDQMAQCSQEAFLATSAHAIPSAQWEDFYDEWELGRTNQSFTPELGSSIQPPKRPRRKRGAVEKGPPLSTEPSKSHSRPKNRFRNVSRKAELRDQKVLHEQLEAQVAGLTVPKPLPQIQLRSRVPRAELGGTRSFSNWSRSEHKRGYSTDASSQYLESQHPSDVSRKPLKERTLEDEISLASLTETQPLEEIVPTGDRFPHPGDKISANETPAPVFWSHKSQLSPSGDKIIVHYCRTLQSTEAMVQHFLGSKVLGFDMEWKSSATSRDGIKGNVSLIQIANQERIGLFQIALFPGKTQKDLVSPSLKKLIESPDVIKVGVAIKADCTRLRKYLGIDATATFELSHLFKLVKFGKDEPKLVNKRGVNLSDQMEEHFGLPLDKNEDVRCGDWTRTLNYQQVQYAATDPYACVRLFHAMEAKREAMDPMPPRPAFAELGQPIILPQRAAVASDEDLLL
ncbi:unnamed protein product [Penicillium salamii]|nr:unnamed protein product [Penicillium salamii]CAG8283748.1 unnamed protein product [Penicillium salamii]